jgi:hypothetical protein
VGSFVTATATNLTTGDTTEFSNCIPAFDDGDDDNDGYTDDAEAGVPLCTSAGNDDAFDDAVANDGCPGGPAQAGAYSEALFKIGTNPLDPCGGDGWGSDIFDTGGSANKLDIQDITSYIGPVRRIDKNPNQAGYGMRWDLFPGKGAFSAFINIQDITTLLNGPGASPAYPPMLGGLRAFGKTCPFPP